MKGRKNLRVIASEKRTFIETSTSKGERKSDLVYFALFTGTMNVKM